MWAEEYLRLHSLHLFWRATEMGVGKQEEQRGIVGWEGGLPEEVERERRPCILLLFSLFLPDWKISRPPVFLGWGLVGRVISRPAGERLQRSYPPPTRRITFSQKAGKGIGSTGRWGCLVPMYGSVWWATTRRGSRVSGHE